MSSLRNPKFSEKNVRVHDAAGTAGPGSRGAETSAKGSAAAALAVKNPIRATVQIASQERLRRATFPRFPDLQLRMGIGINTGAVVVGNTFH